MVSAARLFVLTAIVFLSVSSTCGRPLQRTKRQLFASVFEKIKFPVKSLKGKRELPKEIKITEEEKKDEPEIKTDEYDKNEDQKEDDQSKIHADPKKVNEQLHVDAHKINEDAKIKEELPKASNPKINTETKIEDKLLNVDTHKVEDEIKIDAQLKVDANKVNEEAKIKEELPKASNTKISTETKIEDHLLNVDAHKVEDEIKLDAHLKVDAVKVEDELVKDEILLDAHKVEDELKKDELPNVDIHTAEEKVENVNVMKSGDPKILKEIKKDEGLMKENDHKVDDGIKLGDGLLKVEDNKADISSKVSGEHLLVDNRKLKERVEAKIDEEHKISDEQITIGNEDQKSKNHAIDKAKHSGKVVNEDEDNKEEDEDDNEEDEDSEKDDKYKKDNKNKDDDEKTDEEIKIGSKDTESGHNKIEDGSRNLEDKEIKKDDSEHKDDDAHKKISTDKTDEEKDVDSSGTTSVLNINPTFYGIDPRTLSELPKPENKDIFTPLITDKEIDGPIIPFSIEERHNAGFVASNFDIILDDVHSMLPATIAESKLAQRDLSAISEREDDTDDEPEEEIVHTSQISFHLGNPLALGLIFPWWPVRDILEKVEEVMIKLDHTPSEEAGEIKSELVDIEGRKFLLKTKVVKPAPGSRHQLYVSLVSVTPLTEEEFIKHKRELEEKAIIPPLLERKKPHDIAKEIHKAKKKEDCIKLKEEKEDEESASDSDSDSDWD